MSLGIVIQARMGSTRLPGKVLSSIAGRPLLGHVLGRLEALSASAKVVVATSALEQDIQIQMYCDTLGVACFRGSETDVLARYAQVASDFDMTQVVRLTADNPFTDIEELDRLIQLHRSNQSDYSHSFGEMPVGVGAEIFSREALEQSEREGLAPHHREHVNEYIQENPERFRINVLDIPTSKCNPGLRLTVDTVEDYQLACRLAERASGPWLTTMEAIALCTQFA